jgi:hypothetical protein
MSLRDWWEELKDLFGKPKSPPNPEPKPDEPRTVRHPWGPQKESPVWSQKKDEE